MSIVFPARNSKYLLVVLFVLTFFLSGICEASLKDIETAIIEEDYQKAGELAQAFIDTKPAKAELDEALYFLGLSELRLGDYEAARKNFNLLVSGFPKENLRDKAYLGYVDSLYLDGNYPSALKIAEELLSKSPRSEYLSLIYLKLARSNLKMGNWQKARDYLKKVINDSPKSLEAHTAKQLLEEKQYFAVQVGAFLDQGRAETLTDKLMKQGEYAYIVETVDREGKKFYRVRIGKLAVLNEAQKLENKLKGLGYPTSIYP